ncbi:putative carboxypeptidase s1 protein [Phaeoacremonium minimum UCRPA7]|uniref:Putative carboxypeptidase s1 protein n=1 Tax=Phaeoacremonium minimum (strain UCR-PA7) TaxID=1286976 RepID=R8BRK7_PHAM7|nr:putative carboxypeptidase s1 protein [Phaeoacremonium minimum UCRPA7]EOO01959.1 putative carboxypeptidase s1 protein [Phaeoacremonium minimum UCRPA7]
MMRLTTTIIPEYFQNQNDAIDAGTLSAEKINLVALGINNGWIDATIQYGAYVDFAYNNSYRQLINESEYVSLKEEFETGCLPRLQACPGETGTDAACQDADDFCYENVEAYVMDDRS